MVKSLHAIQETWVQSLVWEYPLEKRNGNPPQYSCLENSMDRGVWRDYSPWGRRELESTEHALAGWWVRGGEILLSIIE